LNITLFSKKDRWKRLKHFWQGTSCQSMIEDKRPISTLLDQNQQPISDMIPYGHLPIALTKGVCLKFVLTPNSQKIYGIRLRIGTYCRINHSHIYLQMGSFVQYFAVDKLIDNALTDIIFSTPYACRPGHPLEIMIYSEDATAENSVAIWCSQAYPQFVHQLQLTGLHFLQVTLPRVSIVIPVFNKVLYTYNCLLTLQNCDQNIAQEVIIVNNASSDETIPLLSQLSGTVKILNNQDNQGFVNACRQGAEIAQGEFVVFLNNDTQVTPGWLSQMLKIMDEQPMVGITGSKLIYPNGYLQEAGGIIFSDASGCNYGRFQDPTDARFNQSRPVDYCSGASLMIRKTLWQQLGGFDQRFAPAYYEDTDLCFAVRQAGYQVFYCHTSEVIHHEGITAGTDLQKGYKAYQAINRRKFQAKWWKVLATHLPPQTPPEVAAVRLMAQHSDHFRIPTDKILAVHFLV
jgi:GT2 family glycosyltransferase